MTFGIAQRRIAEIQPGSGWLTVLRENEEANFRTTSAASKATYFLLGFAPAEEALS